MSSDFLVEDDWTDLVRARHAMLARFLSWAAEREATNSMRLARRPDIARTARVSNAFDEGWWAAVVYSCFDAEAGTLAVSRAFRSPVPPEVAGCLLADIDLPEGAVGGHRIQPAHRGAKTALVSACERAGAFESILTTGTGFHDRFVALRDLRAPQWGRTTCYDLLVRTGQLKIGTVSPYEPDRAYLADSTGPRKGFELIWGIAVTRSNAEACEALLRRWTNGWEKVAGAVGVQWRHEPYRSGDFENALCIFQERGNPGYGLLG